MPASKIKLDKGLLERAKRCAKVAGYASVEEFITHIVEREIDKLEQDGDSEEDIRKQLEGLGYI